MKDIFYISNKKYSLNLLKLIGSFVFFIGLIGLFVSIANLYQNWYTLNNLSTCYEKAETTSQIMSCKETLYNQTKTSMFFYQKEPTESQKTIILFTPFISLLWWVVVALLGILIHNLNNLQKYLNKLPKRKK